MAMLTLEEMQHDHLVMSVARALALANEAVQAHGTDPADSLVTMARSPVQVAISGASATAREIMSIGAVAT